MGAVIRTGGKQYRAEVGQQLVIERVRGEVGDPVSFEEVLARGTGDTMEIGSPTLPGLAVHGTIVAQRRGRKILVFRRKRRKNVRRLNGHRQHETVVEITAIGGTAPRKASEQAATKQAATPKAAAGKADKLTRINGIGPVMENKLLALGITSFRQIAELDEALKASIEEQLNIGGRIDRENWINQAKQLVG